MKKFQKRTLFGLITLVTFSGVPSPLHAATYDRNAEPSPQNFLWGVANSAFQVEGSPVDSDWKRWTETPGKIADKSDANVATDFWNRSEEDFKLAQDLGANSFRISIAWERIQPQPGQWDESALTHYENMLVQMRAHHLEPVVTLQHFTIPGWLVDKGGLLAREFPNAFAEYAEKVVARLSAAPASVALWMTFNEPMVMVNMGYLDGRWPPGLVRDNNRTVQATANIARAHIEAVRRIRRLERKNVRIGIAKHWRDFEADGFWNIPLAKMSDRVFNRQLIEALMTGKLNFWMPGAPRIKETLELPQWRPTLDYLGLNYYGRSLVSASIKSPFVNINEGPGAKNDLGWEIYPQGLYNALKQASSFNLPLLISENGIADAKDTLRPDFIKDHIAQMRRAQAEQIKVIGYLHWSLTDNFEWASGLEPRFGLVEIEYPSLKRSPRPSFKVYQKIISDSAKP